MKLWTILTSLGAAAAVCVFAMSAQASAPKHSVLNSKHNMNNAFAQNTIFENQVCLPCHAPHHQPDPTLDTLWNHTMPGTGYTLYGTVTRDTSGNINGGYVGLDETSKKCLSCHDGAIGVDSYGSYQFVDTNNGYNPAQSTFLDSVASGQSTGNHKVTGAWVIGGGTGNLQHDHPVGVTYPGANADGSDSTSTSWNHPGTDWKSTQYTGYNTANVLAPSYYVDTDLSTHISTVGGSFNLGTAAGFSNVVGCGSCHTPHSDNYNFLRIKNVNSQLCLTCHRK